LELVRIQALDKYLDDSAVEISFVNGLTKMHIKEFLFFKDFDLPDYLKLFYEQTNGLLIESKYTKDDFGDASLLRIHTLEDLFFTKKKVNFLPEKRFIQFGTNDNSAFYLLDTENMDPNGNPLFSLNMPADKFCIPLTNSFDIFLESACIGLLGYLEQFGSEVRKTNQLSKRMLKEKETIKRCLKDLFITAKREYELLDIWHLDVKAKKMVQFSIAKWFKEIQHLLSILQ
jgi:hypothetical protein